MHLDAVAAIERRPRAEVRRAEVAGDGGRVADPAGHAIGLSGAGHCGGAAAGPPASRQGRRCGRRAASPRTSSALSRTRSRRSLAAGDGEAAGRAERAAADWPGAASSSAGAVRRASILARRARPRRRPTAGSRVRLLSAAATELPLPTWPWADVQPMTTFDRSSASSPRRARGQRRGRPPRTAGQQALRPRPLRPPDEHSPPPRVPRRASHRRPGPGAAAARRQRRSWSRERRWRLTDPGRSTTSRSAEADPPPRAVRRTRGRAADATRTDRGDPASRPPADASQDG